MSEQPWMSGPPGRLLLATDLSARCDRALDRAAQLAGEWKAELIALNVQEAPTAPDQMLSWASGEDDEGRHRIARQQLHRDLAGLDVQVDVRTARGGEVPAIIREAAADSASGLVVTGVARSEPFGRFLLGSTVERLARTLPTPLLVVRTRARGSYQRIVVATDFSDSSRHALHAAARFFPGRELVLYHAYQLPLSGIAGATTPARTGQDIETGECAAFLAASDLPADVRSRLRVVVGQGALETALCQYVREQEVDLVVMGTHGRSGLLDVLLGSTASRLLDWLPCDTLIVREPRAST
jgi:nucleotide-binding universal stress UspA family protein